MNFPGIFEALGLLGMLAAVLAIALGRIPKPSGRITPIVAVLVTVALIKYAVNVLEWFALIPAETIALPEDYLDNLLPMAWFYLFFALRITLDRIELEDVNQKLEQTLQQLQEAQQHSVRNERLKALGQMASGVSHDFNNNLMTIMGYTELLLAPGYDLSDVEQTRRNLLSIDKSVQQAASVVRRLRALYSPAPAEAVSVPLDLSKVIQEAIDLTRPGWQNQSQIGSGEVRLKTDFPGNAAILGNKATLIDLYTNLILNAVQAMPEGGELSFRIEVRGDRVFSMTHDSGVGMSEDVLRHCFDPFYTTKQGSGTGLGLFLVEGIVQSHDGSIDVKSAPGRGTLITICFPSCKIVPEEEASGRNLERKDPKTVLLVDDDDRVRGIVEKLLRSMGHEVVPVSSTANAYDLAIYRPFDLIITDQSMPGETGVELATRLKRQRPELPIILLTGFHHLMESGQGLPDSVDLIIGKPVKREELQRAIHGLCLAVP